MMRFIREFVDVMRGIRDDSATLRGIVERSETTLQQIQLQTWIAKEAAMQGVEDLVCLRQGKYADPRSLTSFSSRVFSQNGEDGIIAEIFKRIGTTNRQFVEIGVGDGTENNSRFLLLLGWSGIWIEGDQGNGDKIRHEFASLLATGQLLVRHQRMTLENIDQLLTELQTEPDVDFMSIDIDMNTHHIWSGITRIRPRALCIEYNASFPRSVDYGVPYHPDAMWDMRSSYFGASLLHLSGIAAGKGYGLVGCDFNGVNAFFVRNDLLETHFLAPGDVDVHYEPPRFSLIGRGGHPPADPRTIAAHLAMQVPAAGKRPMQPC